MDEPPTPLPRERNKKAMGILYNIVDDHSLEEIESCETAKQMWDRLKETRARFDSWNGMLSLGEFTSSKKTDEEDMMKYWSRKVEMLLKLQ